VQALRRGDDGAGHGGTLAAHRSAARRPAVASAAPPAHADPMSAIDLTTAVVIYTDQFRIAGRIELLPGARLTDFIRNAADFIAVTDAQVADGEGKPMFSAAFLDVHKDRIELVVPADMVQPV
jgi:hypothetical protein